MFDAAVIGGGVAGLQAALTLARTNRSVLLLDAAQPRHRFSMHMHNLLGADGLSPTEFYARAHADLARYKQVTRVQAAVTGGEAIDGGFRLTDAQGTTYNARKLLFATGVADILPPIPGLAEQWGSRVLHCAYCHGYEVHGKRLAVVIGVEEAWAMVEALWSLKGTLQFFFKPGDVPDANLQAQMQARSIACSLQPITQVTAEREGLALQLADGSRALCDALFVKPHSVATCKIPFELGCGVENEAFIAVNSWGGTHARGVFAAGDVAGAFQQLAAAQVSGLRAAVALSNELTRDALA